MLKGELNDKKQHGLQCNYSCFLLFFQQVVPLFLGHKAHKVSLADLHTTIQILGEPDNTDPHFFRLQLDIVLHCMTTDVVHVIT